MNKQQFIMVGTVQRRRRLRDYAHVRVNQWARSVCSLVNSSKT